jgi:hypothetical protein
MQRPRGFDLRGSVLFAVVGAAAALSVASPAFGQEADQTGAADQAALAKTAQNPLATIVTFPFQFNFNNGVGPYERRQTTLNIQPVIPFPAGKMTVISRLILPYVSNPVGETDAVTGFADWSWSLFVSPKPKGNLSWGVGPAFSLPLATNPEALGSGKLSLGPTAVLFWGPGSWTVGFVVNNIWSIAGDSDRESVNKFFAQWFINYNFGGGWALGTAPIVTADWNAPSGEQWVVPLGLQLSKVLKFGTMPVNVLAGYYSNVEHPDGGAEDQIRVQINMMFPQ